MRPGLFVYSTADGFAWVEPSYREAEALTMPAFYQVRGRITLRADGFTCEGEDGRSYIVGDAAAMEPGSGEDIKRVLAWAAADIEAEGSTMQAERESLRQLLIEGDSEP